ncbi:MAG: hypothetical protein ACI9KK_001904 [Ascidiaceihabitans sp.]|jgi:hypothetical protein
MPTLNNLSAGALMPGLMAMKGGAVPTLTEDVKAPSNSELRKIAEDISGALKYSFASVASNASAKVRSGSVEADMKSYFKGLDATKSVKYAGVTKSLVESKDSVRLAMFGRAGKRSAAEHIGVAGGFAKFDSGLPELKIDRGLLGVKVPKISISRDLLTSTAEGLLIPRELFTGTDFESLDDEQSSDFDSIVDGIMDRARLEDIWGVFGAAEEAEGDSDFEAVTTDKLGLWIKRVKCVDETNPEWWGHDEIAIGGQSIDEDGDVKRINETFVGGGFDDGDQKVYNPDWRFHWFNIREGDHWPKSYRVLMLLAEKDNGGFQQLLNRLYATIRDRVKAAIAKAVTEAVTSVLGPVIGRAIGQITAWIVDEFIKWLINLFGDDFFPTHVASVTTPSMSARWRYSNGAWGNPQSPVQTAHFYGHGGHYLVNYYWKFFS